MKLGRRHWKQRLDVTKELWRRLRPNELLRDGWVNKSDFFFKSTRRLGSGVDFIQAISAWQLGEESWSIRVRGRILDKRVSTMRSQLVGYDVTGLYSLDFDLLAASSLMDGKPVPHSPCIGIEASNAEVASHLADYCLMMDRIWAFFGGASVENLRTLAVWMIQNRGAVGESDASVPMVCLAYVYGETELSLSLLAEIETELITRMRADPSDLFDEVERELGRDVPDSVRLVPSREQVAEIATQALAEAGRLRKMIEQGYRA